MEVNKKKLWFFGILTLANLAGMVNQIMNGGSVFLFILSLLGFIASASLFSVSLVKPNERI